MEKECAECSFACPALDDENVEAVELIDASGTQWRSSGFGVIGLDYPAVFAVAERIDIDVDDAMLHKLRAVERVTLAEDRKRAEKDKEKTNGD